MILPSVGHSPVRTIADSDDDECSDRRRPPTLDRSGAGEAERHRASTRPG